MATRSPRCWLAALGVRQHELRQAQHRDLADRRADHRRAHQVWSRPRTQADTPYYITQWQDGKLIQVQPLASGVTFAR